MLYVPPYGLNASIDYMIKMDPTTYDITKIKLDVDPTEPVAPTTATPTLLLFKLKISTILNKYSVTL
jgi:hypothetical protein